MISCSKNLNQQLKTTNKKKFQEKVINHKKIGLFGGTFDPFHFCHLNVILAVKKKLKLEEVWLLPTSRNPDKLRFPTPLKQRLEIISFFTEKKQWIKIKTDFLPPENEFEYTATTFQKIQKKYQNHTFFFIIGDDLLPTLRSWGGIYFLLSNLTFVVIPRLDKVPSYFKTWPFRKCFIFLDFKKTQISSSEIRRGENLRKGLPKKVINYINEHFLYVKERLLFQLRGNLSRYQHLLNSSEVAYKLAGRCGFNKTEQKKIKFATLFHDVTKMWTKEEHLNFLTKHKCLPWKKEPFFVLHQFTGMLFLKHNLFVKSKSILTAVCYHTTGFSKPNLFQKIVFLSDKISPERKGFFVEFLRFLIKKKLLNYAYQNCLLFSLWRYGIESKTFSFVTQNYFCKKNN